METTQNPQLILSTPLVRYLEAEQKHGIQDSLDLINYFSVHKKEISIRDFSFLVFPAARAYEGYLKTLFYRQGLISESVYKDKHFRIGRSFNPDLPIRLRDEFWIYDNVENVCGKDMARRLWNLWLKARNHIFHYRPDEKYQMEFSEASHVVQELVNLLEEVMRCEFIR